MEELIDDLRRLVSVESPSLQPEALAASAENLAALIEERTGRAATLIDSVNGPHVHWSGGGDPTVLILGHHDTVFPLGTLDERPFAVVGGRATGPGVYDMKAGIVQAVHAVAGLDDVSGVELLFTADEEIGSVASRPLLEERAIACGNVLVLEPSAEGGALKVARKGAGFFDVVISGRASHAGLEPEKGVNTLVEAAHQILRIAALGDPGAGTTVTPTLASAGTAQNVVPHETRLRLDVRVSTEAEKARVEAALWSLGAVDPRAGVEVVGRIDRPPMTEAASAGLLPLARAVLPDLAGVAVGGGSDGNFTAALGVPTLDGLGAVGGGAHAAHEWIELGELPRRVALVHGILVRLLAVGG